MGRLKKAIDNPAVEVVQCKTVEELVRNSEIICTATLKSVDMGLFDVCIAQKLLEIAKER